MDLNKFGIYCIKCITTNRLYIGSTTRTFNSRFREHLFDLKNDKHGNKHLQNIYNKYGIANLEFSILEIVEDDANILTYEQKYIDELKPEINISQIAGMIDPTVNAREWLIIHPDGIKEKVFNLEKYCRENNLHAATMGAIGNGHDALHKGYSCKKLTIETRKKVDTSNRIYNVSEETRAKIGAKHKGKEIPQEMRDRISQTLTGRKLSEEVKLNAVLGAKKARLKSGKLSGINKTKSNKYNVQLFKNKRKLNLGIYDSIEKAIEAKTIGDVMLWEENKSIEEVKEYFDGLKPIEICHITHPDGVEEKVTDINKFAKTHNLDAGRLRSVGNKHQNRTHHKGYKVENLTPDKPKL